MSRYIHSDADFGNNELLNARLENRSALSVPSSNLKGKMEYLRKPFFIDDFGKWIGLHTDFWSNETDGTYSYDSNILETASLTVNSGVLHNTFDNIYKRVAYLGSEARTFGTLARLGSSNSVNWDLQQGRRFVLVAQNGAWFNIGNNLPNMSDNHKPIITGTNGTIYNVNYAEFIYNSGNNAWNVVSYSKVPFWRYRYTFDILDHGSGSYQLRFDDLPAEGFYEVHTYSEIAERPAIGDPTRVNTTGEQRIKYLSLAGINNFNFDVAISPTYNDAASGTRMVNHSLQGSAIVEIKDVIGNRQLLIQLHAPNGNFRDFKGYVHIQFKGYDADGSL